MITPVDPSSLHLTRRQAVGALATLASATIAAPFLGASPSSKTDPFALPPLPYAFDALEPAIDARTMEIHHDRHHAGYVANTNRLLADHADLRALGPIGILQHLDRVPASIRPGVRNNLGGHVNHTFFWPLLAAPHSYTAGPLQQAIKRQFGSLAAFQTEFAQAAGSRFGSGWAWLSAESDGSLVVHSTANQDSPWSEGRTPLIGLDVWEHAYYLHYQNRRADYVKAFWDVLNWDVAEAHYADR